MNRPHSLCKTRDKEFSCDTCMGSSGIRPTDTEPWRALQNIICTEPVYYHHNVPHSFHNPLDKTTYRCYPIATTSPAHSSEN